MAVIFVFFCKVGLSGINKGLLDVFQELEHDAVVGAVDLWRCDDGGIVGHLGIGIGIVDEDLIVEGGCGSSFGGAVRVGYSAVFIDGGAVVDEVTVVHVVYVFTGEFALGDAL